VISKVLCLAVGLCRAIDGAPHTLGTYIIERTQIYRPPYSRRAAGPTALPNKDLGRQVRFSSVSGELDNPVCDSRLVLGEGYVSPPPMGVILKESTLTALTIQVVAQDTLPRHKMAWPGVRPTPG
jgi:hypothetical protein